MKVFINMSADENEMWLKAENEISMKKRNDSATHSEEKPPREKLFPQRHLSNILSHSTIFLPVPPAVQITSLNLMLSFLCLLSLSVCIGWPLPRLCV